jgi:hypothetical protein
MLCFVHIYKKFVGIFVFWVFLKKIFKISFFKFFLKIFFKFFVFFKIFIFFFFFFFFFFLTDSALFLKHMILVSFSSFQEYLVFK